MCVYVDIITLLSLALKKTTVSNICITTNKGKNTYKCKSRENIEKQASVKARGLILFTFGLFLVPFKSLPPKKYCMC